MCSLPRDTPAGGRSVRPMVHADVDLCVYEQPDVLFIAIASKRN